MRYFTDCKTAEELKKAYRTWAKKLHPDLGGNAEEFKVMQAEYEKLWERLKKGNNRNAAGVYQYHQHSCQAERRTR